MKIVNTEDCTFCEEVREDYLHLFFHCKYVKNIWEMVEKKINVKLTEKTVLLNTVLDNKKHAENTVVLIVKYYIYCSKCMNKIPTVKGVQQKIVNHISLEHEIARKNNKIGHHDLKWSNVKLDD